MFDWDFISKRLSFIQSLSSITIFSYLIGFIIRNKKHSFIRKSHPNCSIIILFLFLLEQLTSMAIDYLILIEDIDLIIKLSILKNIIVDYLILFSIIIKSIPIINMAQFSYYHLVPGKDKQKFKAEYFDWRKNNPDQDTFYKTFILFYIAFVILIAFFLLKGSLEVTRYILLFNHPFESINSMDEFEFIVFVCFIIGKYTFYFFGISIYIFIVMQLTIYPNNDICLLKNELAWYLLPLINYKVLSIMRLYHNNEGGYNGCVNSLIVFSFAFGLMYFWLYRFKLNSNSINSLIVHYHTFMLNSLCFTYLKSVIKNSFALDTPLITFWESYYYYQRKLKHRDKFQKHQLILDACALYETHFFRESTELDLIMTPNYIQIPDAIYETLVKAYKLRFCISTNELNTIFAGVFRIVNKKLKNLYELIKSDKKTKRNLKTMILFTEFDDLQEEFDYEQLY